MPKPVHQAAIKCFISIKSPSVKPGTRFRLMPDGNPELVIQLGVPPVQQYGKKNQRFVSTINLVGNLSKYEDVEVYGAQDIVIVKFQPWTLGFLLKDSAKFITDQQVPTFSLFQSWEQELFSQASESTDISKAIPILEQWIDRKFKDWEPDQELCKAIRLINSARGNLKVKGLESHLDNGIRRLEQKFADEMGLSVKYYARLCRTRCVAEKIFQQPELNLMDIAFEHGFFDQAHFIKDFQHFTAHTPRKFKKKFDESNSFFGLQFWRL